MSAQDVARRLPDPPTLRDRCRSMAMLDAVMQPDKPYLRRHGFDAHWSPARELASMDNGGGDTYSIVFSAAGTYMIGFDHTSDLNPYASDGQEPFPGVLDSVPEVFRACVEEPSFRLDDVPMVTACLWREAGDTAWRTGDVDPRLGDDGADWLFDMLTDGTPQTYAEWATSYFDAPVDLDAVRDVYALRPLTADLVRALNPAVTPEHLGDAAAAIGYPRAS
ncbi:hypothetical protein [Streptomyces sp. V2I9]|uniref:hypothetical protein n=1 Tax=Streptomyces sp. V2I9 TaxID=3042304 RepID=UPI002782FC36|nr:hypothetical protein [Streptomyces sp. V2I9]MDQ0987770.1 hypothetical protein [Streptomyces sp. V2I9]